MQRQRRLDVAKIDELVDLPVRVAGDVAQDGVARRPLVEPMDGHHRKELLDGPTVWHRLKQRKIAEVDVGQNRIEILKLFGNVVHFSDQSAEFSADRPEERFRLAAVLQRKVAAAGYHCDVIAPNSIPRVRGNQIKTDRVDAEKLARFYATNQLTLVAPPEESQERDRDNLFCHTE